MPNHPLAEVFGYPTDNFSAEADHCRQGRLCPFKEKRKDGTLQKCNKDKKDDPLGVCSVFNTGGERVITCPVRFQQEWLIARDAAGFFFPMSTDAERVTEVRLTDQDGKSVGSIDVVLLVPDAQGRVTDYGSLEVQAVYISGNIRRAFEHYMEDPAGAAEPSTPGLSFLLSQAACAAAPLQRRHPESLGPQNGGGAGCTLLQDAPCSGRSRRSRSGYCLVRV